MNLLRWVSMVILISSLAAAPARACRCAVGPPRDQPCGAIADRVVFSGRVASTEVATYFPGGGGEDLSREMRRVRFDVEEAFRGVESSTVEVWTGFGEIDCGFPFEVGGRYFVYATEVEETSTLHTSTCGRTRLLAGASQDLAYGRLFKAGQAKTRIVGHVYHSSATEDGHRQIRVPMVGVRVWARGPIGRIPGVLTDAGGEFVMEPPQAGRYEVHGEMPEGLPEVEPIWVEVEAGTCGSATFEATSLAVRLEGIVLTPEGQPVGRARISLRPVWAPDTSSFQEVSTDEKGHFEAAQVIPGEYLLIFNDDAIRGFPPRVYFPGTFDRMEAQTVELAGEVRDLGFFTLPSRDALTTISAQIRSPSAIPYSSLEIRVEPAGELPFFPEIQDSGNDFTFQAVPGLTYRMQACVQGDPPRCTAETKVVAGSPESEEELILHLPSAEP